MNIKKIINLAIEKMKLKKGIFENFEIYTDEIDAENYTVIWDSDEDFSLLVKSNENLSSGHILMFYSELDNLYGEMDLDWQNEKEKSSETVGEELLANLIDEFETLVSLGVLDEPRLEFNFTL